MYIYIYIYIYICDFGCIAILLSNDRKYTVRSWRGEATGNSRVHR